MGMTIRYLTFQNKNYSYNVSEQRWRGELYPLGITDAEVSLNFILCAVGSAVKY